MNEYTFSKNIPNQYMNDDISVPPKLIK